MLFTVPTKKPTTEKTIFTHIFSLILLLLSKVEITGNRMYERCLQKKAKQIPYEHGLLFQYQIINNDESKLDKSLIYIIPDDSTIMLGYGIRGKQPRQ